MNDKYLKLYKENWPFIEWTNIPEACFETDFYKFVWNILSEIKVWALIEKMSRPDKEIRTEENMMKCGKVRKGYQVSYLAIYLSSQ